MKSSKEIKKKLHEYIDSIDDEETLWMLHEDVVEYIKKEKTEQQEDDYLTDEQEKELSEAIKQVDAGEFVTEEEYLKATARWRTK